MERHAQSASIVSSKDSVGSQEFFRRDSQKTVRRAERSAKHVARSYHSMPHLCNQVIVRIAQNRLCQTVRELLKDILDLSSIRSICGKTINA